MKSRTTCIAAGLAVTLAVATAMAQSASTGSEPALSPSKGQAYPNRPIRLVVPFPPGTQASNHHHEGAEHFMYVTKGRGTAWANEKPFPVKQGDLIHYADRERHHLRSEGDEEIVFVEFFVPGEYKTIWAPGAAVCTWLPTGRDIKGRKPAREIEAHSSAPAESPQDV